jgi:hypothetical protein
MSGGIPHNPIAPDWYSTTYDMTQVIMTNSQTTTNNFYGNLNLIGLMTPSDRLNSKRYFQYKNTNIIYKIDDVINTNDYYLCYPSDLNNDGPVYLVLGGTHTPAQLALDLNLANNNPNYDTLVEFTSIPTLIESIKNARLDLFGGSNREFILTGFSLGGTKAIYAHYNAPAYITKTIVFNPFMGKWNTGYGTDPYPYLNPWHIARLQELHNAGPSSVPLGFQNIYINYVTQDFASKYWQSSHLFSASQLPYSNQNLNLSLSWGVNFKFPYTNAPTDILPLLLPDWTTRQLDPSHAHTINNWVHTTLTVYTPIYGYNWIHSKQYLDYGGHQGDSTIAASIGDVPIYMGHADGSAYQGNIVIPTQADLSYYIWDFIPSTNDNKYRISSKKPNHQLDVLIQLFPTDLLDGIQYYYIKTVQNTFFYLNTTTYNQAFAKKQLPNYIPIELKTEVTFNQFAPSNRLHFNWSIGSSGNFTAGFNTNGTRRMLLSTDYNGLHFWGDHLTEINVFMRPKYFNDDLVLPAHGGPYYAVLNSINDGSKYAGIRATTETNATWNVDIPSSNNHADSAFPDETILKLTYSNTNDCYILEFTESSNTSSRILTNSFDAGANSIPNYDSPDAWNNLLEVKQKIYLELVDESTKEFYIYTYALTDTNNTTPYYIRSRYIWGNGIGITQTKTNSSWFLPSVPLNNNGTSIP